MPELLFRRDIYGYQQSALDTALTKLRSFADRDLLNPNLAGRLEALADEAIIEVAIIDGGEEGTPRTERRSRNDYGQQIVVDTELMDMHVPFRGNLLSFHLMPSTSKMIEIPAVIKAQELVVTFVYDDDLQRQFGIFMSKVQENLAQLRKEMPGIRTAVRTAIGGAADQRIAIIHAQQERDKTLPFPVRRP